MENHIVRERGEVEQLSDPDSVEESVKRLRRIATLFDEAFSIPGTSLRVGWDSIIGLIPGVGDLVGVAPLAYYLRIASKHKMGAGVYSRLIFNQGVDFLIGTIPLVGDIFDWAFKANVKNAELLISRLEPKRL